MPFADSEGEAFGWAYIDDMLSTQLSNAVLSAAVVLADLALTAGDAVLARWAVERGQKVWPGEEVLDMRALSAAAVARPWRVEQTWTAITGRRILGVKVEPSARLRAHYQRLVEQRPIENLT